MRRIQKEKIMPPRAVRRGLLIIIEIMMTARPMMPAGSPHRRISGFRGFLYGFAVRFLSTSGTYRVPQ